MRSLLCAITLFACVFVAKAQEAGLKIGAPTPTVSSTSTIGTWKVYPPTSITFTLGYMKPETPVCLIMGEGLPNRCVSFDRVRELILRKGRNVK